MSFRSPAITVALQKLVAEGKLELADVQLVTPDLVEADLRRNQVIGSDIDYDECLLLMGGDAFVSRFHAPSPN